MRFIYPPCAQRKNVFLKEALIANPWRKWKQNQQQQSVIKYGIENESFVFDIDDGSHD